MNQLPCLTFERLSRVLPIKEQPDFAFQLVIIMLVAVLIMGELAHTMNFDFKAGSLDLQKSRPS